MSPCSHAALPETLGYPEIQETAFALPLAVPKFINNRATGSLFTPAH
jgi:hypothetical protein